MRDVAAPFFAFLAHNRFNIHTYIRVRTWPRHAHLDAAGRMMSKALVGCCGPLSCPGRGGEEERRTIWVHNCGSCTFEAGAWYLKIWPKTLRTGL